MTFSVRPVVLALVAVIAALALACDRQPPSVSPAPEATAMAGVVGTAAANRTETPESSALLGTKPPTCPGKVGVPRPLGLGKEVAGVFTEPRVTVPVQSVTVPDPISLFPSYVRPQGTASTLLYDFQRREVQDLGPGSYAFFSTDGRYALWTGMEQPGRETVMRRDLQTGATQAMTGGVLFPYQGAPSREALFQYLNASYLVDVATGAVRCLDLGSRLLSDATSWGAYFLDFGQSVGQVEYRGITVSINRLRVARTANWEAVLEMEGLRAVSAGTGSFVLATKPASEGGRVTTNLFLVDIASGSTQFVATADIALQIPVVANERFVAWNERYCEPDVRRVRIFDRRSGVITELRTGLTVSGMQGALLGFSPSGFGVNAWLDLESMTWREVLPPEILHAQWSADHRFASVGLFGGHGGLC